MRTRTILIGVFLALGAAAGGAVLMGYGPGKPTEAPVAEPAAKAPEPLRISPIETLAIRPERHGETLRIEGFVMPQRKVVLSAKFSGVVTEVAADVGDAVKKGEVLVRFDEGQARLQLESREARAKGKQAELDRAERELLRARGLAEGGTVALSKLASTETDLRIVEAERDALKAEEDEARRQLKEAQVIAPFDGTVSLRKVNPGQSVPENTELLEIVDLSRMTLSAAVPLENSPRLSVGQKADIRIEGLPDRQLTARLERIAPAAVESSRSLQIFLAVDASDQRLSGGMFAEGELHAGEQESMIAVPVAALQEKDGQSAILKIENGKVVSQPVKKGRLLEDGKLAEIVSGLKTGDRVIAVPMKGIAPGTAVEITGKDGTAP